MDKLFPFSLEISEDEKKQRNFQVIHKTAPKEYNNYTISIPCVNVYRYMNEKWEKLNVKGTLFLLTSSVSSAPIIFILNNKLLRDPKDFCFRVSKKIEISLQNKLVYLRIADEDNICLSMLNNENAEQFVDEFKKLSLKSDDDNIKQQIKINNKENENDPTYRHLINYIRSSREHF